MAIVSIGVVSEVSRFVGRQKDPTQVVGQGKGREAGFESHVPEN